MKRYLILLALLTVSASLSAQKNNLFVPKELQEAYKNKTRSYTGEPGMNYFQNRSDYEIKADFDPGTGLIKGSEKITYTNNSPDTLNYIVIRLHMNFFKRGIERDFSIPAFDLHDGVNIKNFTIDGKHLNTKDGPQLRRDMGTVQMVQLQDPIAPGSKASLSIDWETQLPQKVAIRMGQYGQNNWFVAYWYPQISVYDDISGWDTHLFTGSAEFYNDFSDFDVTITVPSDYTVWATGILQEPEEHFQPEIYDRFKEAHETDSVVHIITKEDLENQAVLKNSTSWNFKAEHVPDFAFATSSGYLWDGTSISLDSTKDERVFVNAAYKKDSKDFHKVAGLGREIIRLFSQKIMQADFPYPKLTAFNGRGGMEFPMMINDGDVSSHAGTVHLTAHEIGHNYFPFYVMTNESYYAFMDEGLVSFLPREVENYMLEDYNSFDELIAGYESAAGSMKEIPLMVKSYMISDYSAYRTHAYTRPGTAFYLLKNMLGEKDFNKALKAYIERWKWKHPTPYDFFFTFEDVLERDLSWFWKPWFFEFGYPDLAIKEINHSGNQYKVVVEKVGNMPVPVKLKIHYENGNAKLIEKKATVWKEGNAEYTVTFELDRELEKVELGSGTIPDIDRENNIYEK